MINDCRDWVLVEFCDFLVLFFFLLSLMIVIGEKSIIIVENNLYVFLVICYINSSLLEKENRFLFWGVRNNYCDCDNN